MPRKTKEILNNKDTSTKKNTNKSTSKTQKKSKRENKPIL